MPLLLDAETMARALGRSLGNGGPLPAVRARYLRYRPRTSFVVQYDVALDGRLQTAFAMIAAQAGLQRRAGRPESVALAHMVDGRSGVLRPLSYDRELKALIQWFPLDLSLPALAEPPERLRAAIAQAGVDPGEIGDAPQVLAYRPGRRAVLRVGEHVLKLYATDREFEAAARGLSVSSGVRSLRTPALEAVVAPLRLTVQSALPGTAPEDAIAIAPAAGQLLRRLHRSGPCELARFEPRDQLRAAAATCGLWAITPGHKRRVRALLGELQRRMPRPGALVPSHGDFHATHLLRGDELALVDFDRMCAAPAALDLANYAAKMMRGASDFASALEAIELLLDGYGWRFEDMSWYLATAILRRSIHPFRYLDERWLERVEEFARAAETVLAAENRWR